MAADKSPEPAEITVTSSVDGSKQLSRLWTPPGATTEKTPLLVHLHTWSGDYRQASDGWLDQAAAHNWIYLFPNFRGVNNQPQACGSEAARRDILDAIDYVVAHYKVDETRVYLAAASGGGHMTMLMSGYYPERFSAASAWVGISDLAEWYRFQSGTDGSGPKLGTDGKPLGYAKMVLDSCGGAPGASAQVDAEYRARSPIYHLGNVKALPIELCAGVRDGHTGSVPIAHTLKAFNAVAQAGGHAVVSVPEMDELWHKGKLTNPRSSDAGNDPEYGRKILLRRQAGPARVTIFDGGHEGIARAGALWLSRHQRATHAVKFNSKP